MLGGPPWNVFGRRVMACHGTPCGVSCLFVVAFLLSLGEFASHSVKPTELSAIWFEPNKITVAEIRGQTPGNGALHIRKTGIWNRLCPSTSHQSFITEHGGEIINVMPHKISVPSETGPIYDKARPTGIQIPKSLANELGRVRFRLEITSSCWWLENFLPINGGRSEATFEIVP